MQAALALLPSLAVLIAVLVLRWSGLAAATSAAGLAIALWLCGAFIAPALGHATNAVLDAALLTLLVAAMILPGLLFVEATGSRKAPEAIAAAIATVKLDAPRAALLIALGVGVMIESLTGMGVSLLVTIPLLMRLTDDRRAIGLALVGMSLMPWGALSISAHVGAKLAGLPVDELARWVVATSGPVAFSLPFWAVGIMGAWSARDLATACLTGLVLWAAVAAATFVVGVEVAGVIGGLAVIMLFVALARSREGLGAALQAPGLRPYVWLLGLVFVQKAAIALLARAGIAPTLTTGRVSFAILTSPGVALLAATLLSAATTLERQHFRAALTRGWRPFASIALFMVAARVLVECGAIAVLSASLDDLGSAAAVAAVVLLGAVSGFLTGSGITANALFMGSAVGVGTGIGQVPLFAALQNSSGGHVGMASLPVAAILLAALHRRSPGDDALVMRTALKLAMSHTAVILVAGLVLLAIVAR